MNGPKNALPDAFIADDLPPLVKPGVYELAFVSYKTAIMFRGKAPKLILDFRIVTMGSFHGDIVSRYYNVQKVIGKPGRNGKFKCGTKGNFLREYLTLFPHQVKRLDRVPMSAFAKVIIEGAIRTVMRAANREIPKSLRYSCVSELRRVM